MKSFEDQFLKSKGKPIVYNGRTLQMMHRVSLPQKDAILKVSFEEVNSDWRQAISLKTQGDFFIDNGVTVPNSAIFWHDTAPRDFEVKVSSTSGLLIIHNAWDVGNGVVHFWHNGGAMFVEEISDGWRFHCNDGYPDDDLNDLIFTIKLG